MDSGSFAAGIFNCRLRPSGKGETYPDIAEPEAQITFFGNKYEPENVVVIEKYSPLLWRKIRISIFPMKA